MRGWDIKNEKRLLERENIRKGGYKSIFWEENVHREKGNKRAFREFLERTPWKVNCIEYSGENLMDFRPKACGHVNFKNASTFAMAFGGTARCISLTLFDTNVQVMV